MSWDEALAEDYEESSAEMTDDIDFYLNLAREAQGPVVELAVGNGRVAIPVTVSSGRKVIGVDSSPAMLAQARKRADEAGVDLDLRNVDMRELDLEEPVELVYCPYRGLLYLATWADRRLVFERVAASLKPGGRFAWNALAFDHRFAARADGLTRDEPGRRSPRYSVGDVQGANEIRYSTGDNRIDIVREDGAKSSMWWATKNEWLGLLDVAGLELEALYGGFERDPFTDDSTEYVFVARRPLDG